MPGDVIRIPPQLGKEELGTLRASKNEHIVEEGDSFGSIAKKSSIWIQQLKKANPLIRNKDDLIAGQIIRISPDDGSGLCALQAGRNQHTVKRNDTMYSIALWHGISMPEIRRANLDIIDLDKIYPRQIIRIPR